MLFRSDTDEHKTDDKKDDQDIINQKDDVSDDSSPDVSFNDQEGYSLDEGDSQIEDFSEDQQEVEYADNDEKGDIVTPPAGHDSVKDEIKETTLPDKKNEKKVSKIKKIHEEKGIADAEGTEKTDIPDGDMQDIGRDVHTKEHLKHKYEDVIIEVYCGWADAKYCTECGHIETLTLFPESSYWKEEFRTAIDFNKGYAMSVSELRESYPGKRIFVKDANSENEYREVME